MTSNGFIQRKKERDEVEHVEKLSSFGIILGFLIISYSAWELLFILDSNRKIWKPINNLGLTIFVLGIIFPQALYYLEKFWMYVVQWIGKFVFSVFLSLFYFLIITPAGFFYNFFSKNKGSFSSWDPLSESKSPEGWILKSAPSIISENNSEKTGMLEVVLSIFRTLFSQKDWLLIPSIVLLIILGLLFYFIQSSVLAPFIYTLF